MFGPLHFFLQFLASLSVIYIFSCLSFTLCKTKQSVPPSPAPHTITQFTKSVFTQSEFIQLSKHSVCVCVGVCVNCAALNKDLTH